MSDMREQRDEVWERWQHATTSGEKLLSHRDVLNVIAHVYGVMETDPKFLEAFNDALTKTLVFPSR